MTRSPRARRSAFTLIELLGVIAILAILAAIAFPAIDNAIAKSRTATSTQNLKQWGIAVKSFVADKGHYPATRIYYFENPGSGSEVRARWMNILAPYMNADARATTNTQGATAVTNRNGDADQSVFNAAFKDPAVSDWEVGRNNSYGYNAQYLGNARPRNAVGPASPIYRGQQVLGFVNYPVQASSIPRPDKTICIAGCDGSGATNAYRPPATMGGTQPGDGGSMAITADDRIATIGNEGYHLDPCFFPLRDLDNDGALDYDGTAATIPNNIPGSGSGGSRHFQGSRNMITNRHNGGTPVLFADGHVEFLIREDAYFDRSLGVFSNRLWNGFGIGNDRNGDGALTAGETLIDPNEAWFQPGQTAISDGVQTTLGFIGLDAQHRSNGAATIAAYGPGYPGEQNETLRGHLFGPSLPKVGPFPKLETNNVEALGQ